MTRICPVSCATKSRPSGASASVVGSIRPRAMGVAVNPLGNTVSSHRSSSPTRLGRNALRLLVRCCVLTFDPVGERDEDGVMARPAAWDHRRPTRPFREKFPHSPPLYQDSQFIQAAHFM